MKPTDLKSPFTWETRQIMVQDRVWYIPPQYSHFSSFKFQGWNHGDFFENDKPLNIEYCSGNGLWIAAKAQENPDENWVAIEQRFVRVQRIWSKIKNHQLSNLMAVCGEGFAATHHYFPAGSVRNVYINFPDPWPKTRHAKFRLIQMPFIEELRRILDHKGCVTFVTDDVQYSKQVIKLFTCAPGFKSVFPDPYYQTDLPGYGSSYFEDLWRSKGKPIYYHQFQKVPFDPSWN